MSMSAAPPRAERRPAPARNPSVAPSKSGFVSNKPAAPPAPGRATPAKDRPDQAQAARPAPKVSPNATKAEPDILFQTYFKSVGPRTYAAQVKRAGNGNHFVVLTEGKRDDKTGEVRKTRLFVFSEDFSAFFKMLQETAFFVRDNPVPAEVKKKRERFWAKKEAEEKPSMPARSTRAVLAQAKPAERAVAPK